MAKKKLIIEFSESQTEQYLQICRQRTKSEVQEDCLPTGATIQISLDPMFGDWAEVNGQEITGEVKVDFK